MEIVVAYNQLTIVCIERGLRGPRTVTNIKAFDEVSQGWYI